MATLTRLSSSAGVLALFVLLTPSAAQAQVEANFHVTEMNGGCWVDDEEPFFAGDPERYFRIAVFDSSSSSVLNNCANGCSDDGNGATLDGETLDYCSWNTGCGGWNFTNQLIEKIVPNGSGAYFYFGLFDADDDADDSLGDDWDWVSSSMSGYSAENNDNNSPYYPDNPIGNTCGGRDVEDFGTSNNYSFTHRIWFEDQSGPVATSDFTHEDDGLVTDWNNDTYLYFRWTPGNDVHTGVASRTLRLWDYTTSTYVVTVAGQSDGVMDICPSGCDATYTPIDGRLYAAQVYLTNGAAPGITNASTGYGNWAVFRTDLTAPTSAVTGPSASNWQDGNFTASYDDFDATAGLDYCQWRAVSNGVTTRSWVDRTCDGTSTVTVGSSSNCRNQGGNTCVISTRSRDNARLWSSTGSRTYSIDWSNDTIGSVTARTSSSGSTIPESSWTTDRDPYFSWTIGGTTYAPIDAYYWAVDSNPSCSGTSTSGGTTGSVQLANNALSEGVHTFRVRPDDDAGNCGNIYTHTVQVDYTQDGMTNLRATNDDGPIGSGEWQPDNSLTMAWNVSSSTAPMLGYSYSTSGTPDCVADTSATSLGLTSLGQGVTTFQIRPIDQAGNCGTVASFNLAVDGTQESITGLQALTNLGGSTIGDGVFQSDNTPYMTWSTTSSTAPVAGYSWDITGTPNCTIDIAASNIDLAALPDGVTTFQVRPIDEAGNCGASSSFDLAVDTAGSAITSLEAFTDSGQATAIATGEWQDDTTPYLIWTADTSTSDIIGYAVSTSGNPTCPSVDTASNAMSLGPLSDGVTRFQIQAIDEANNCGPVATYDIAVDTTLDDIDGLAAFTEPEDEGGVAIGDGEWQRDTDPVMTWDPSTSTAPIAGYSWTQDGSTPDCTSDTDQTSVALATLSQGLAEFSVRAIDEAGNCGPTTSYDIGVDVDEDTVDNLHAVSGGDDLADGEWDNDDSPLMEWDDSSSTSPIVGYSWSSTGDPDCSVEGSLSEHALSNLGDGITSFRVRVWMTPETAARSQTLTLRWTPPRTPSTDCLRATAES